MRFTFVNAGDCCVGRGWCATGVGLRVRLLCIAALASNTPATIRSLLPGHIPCNKYVVSITLYRKTHKKPSLDTIDIMIDIQILIKGRN